jgi:hypothetical protein
MELAHAAATSNLPNRALAFSPDGKQLAVGSDFMNVKVCAIKERLVRSRTATALFACCLALASVRRY